MKLIIIVTTKGAFFSIMAFFFSANHLGRYVKILLNFKFLSKFAEEKHNLYLHMCGSQQDGFGSENFFHIFDRFIGIYVAHGWDILGTRIFILWNLVIYGSSVLFCLGSWITVGDLVRYLLWVLLFCSFYCSPNEVQTRRGKAFQRESA